MNMHARIMNMNCVPENMDAEPNQRLAYKVGHRDARHAAAELSLAADKLADALRDIAKQDPVEMALDPQWAARVARITLTECGYEA